MFSGLVREDPIAGGVNVNDMIPNEHKPTHMYAWWAFSFEFATSKRTFLACTFLLDSLAVRNWREKEDRRKGQEKHWELAGTELGDLTGVKKKEDEIDADGAGDKDYKTSHQFSDHMNVPLEAASDFAREKTLKCVTKID